MNDFDEGGVQWQNKRCHRSAQSGQARAAQMIEEADPHTSVTFVHVACSGGRIYEALLDTYDGIVFRPEDEPLRAQIDRVAELADDAEIDALFVSIGGNDINFSTVVEACVLARDCHLGSPTIDSLLESTASLTCGLTRSFEDECKSYLDPDVIDDLPRNYDALAEAIVDSLDMDPARVYLTELRAAMQATAAVRTWLGSRVSRTPINFKATKTARCTRTAQ